MWQKGFWKFLNFKHGCNFGQSNRVVLELSTPWKIYTRTQNVWSGWLVYEVKCLCSRGQAPPTNFSIFDSYDMKSLWFKFCHDVLLKFSSNHAIYAPRSLPTIWRRTQNHPWAVGRRPKDAFVSKWVYNFWPAKNLCTYQDIHIWGGQQQKNGVKSSKP